MIEILVDSVSLRIDSEISHRLSVSILIDSDSHLRIQ